MIVHKRHATKHRFLLLLIVVQVTILFFVRDNVIFVHVDKERNQAVENESVTEREVVPPLPVSDPLEESNQRLENSKELVAEVQRVPVKEVARLKNVEESRLKGKEEMHVAAEEEHRLKDTEEARIEGEEARIAAKEEEAKAEEETRLKVKEKARVKAEEGAEAVVKGVDRLKTEEEARLKAKEEMKVAAEEDYHSKDTEEERVKEEEALIAAKEEETRVEEEISSKVEEEARIKAEGEAEAAPFSVADPFALWSRRDQVSNETVSDILQILANRDSASCFNNTVSIPMNSLEQIAFAIRKKYSNERLEQQVIIAVLGDSVSADPQGWVEALQSFLEISPALNFPFEVRNYAVGGTGPHYTYFCNELKGDEDIVVFENVRPYEPQAVVDLASSLVIRGYGVILANWHGPETWKLDSRLYGFEEASHELNLPLLNVAANRESVARCLPANANLSIPEEKQIYRDEVHPNRVGELLLATLVGRVIEEAVSLYNGKNLNLNDLENKRLSSGMFNASATLPTCFNVLNCTSAAERGFDPTQCLEVTANSGFNLRSIPSGKTWWEGTEPGHSIEITLPGSCSTIVMFHNLRVTNGMVKVDIDGAVPESIDGFTNGILNGWYKGYWWLPKSRGALTNRILAHNLQRKKQHTLRLTVLNTTDSEDGTYKFDFNSIACK